MDLGIKGRRAIVCASSKGLGRACAIALANEGVNVTLTARGAEALKKTADEIRKANPGVTVTEIVGDITTPAGRFGEPEEFGLACAFLCGAKAGYITGQNILLDGGAFPGTL